ncbi:uncharacterized protein Hap1MRO34_017485 [Clarias gariepinus]|uniref:uncharacterized protein si:ch211-227n13.3 n=1 Tax=Clarias gariepinus TaxID=13013 RepID=UPI00234DB276|nr:uncharacterized protein si:ch211-227n13.3 [Clarias gariepinus]
MEYRRGTQVHRVESKQKIFLPMGSKAEDTLKMLRVNKATSGHVWLSDSPSKARAESPLDGSGSEDSVVSGPSSPSSALLLLRCRACERLFSKMRRQEQPRKKLQVDDPASLSCDEWMLIKTRQPLRWHQRRGLLWVHLKRIRGRAAKQSDDCMVHEAWSFCSRPHVFLQRNLRLCKKVLGKPSKRKAKSLNKRRNQANRSGKNLRQKKRKSSEKDDTTEQVSPLDLSITSSDKPPANDVTHHEGVQRSEKVSKKQSVTDVSGIMDVQANSSSLEGTRRVLKFDSSPIAVVAETQKPQQHMVHKNAEEKVDFTAKNRDCLIIIEDDGLCEDSDVFRTPTDTFSTGLEVTKKSRPSVPRGGRKGSFRTMLAASLGQSHNKIIKESHH